MNGLSAAGARCPICDAAMPAPWAEYPDYPFCTKRCRVIDLGRWLGEDYKVARPDDGPAEDRSTPADPDGDDS